MQDYISVATFVNELDAELAHATLAAAGIPAYLKFDDTGGMMPVLQHIRGIRLLVRVEDVPEAELVLSTPPVQPPLPE